MKILISISIILSLFVAGCAGEKRTVSVGELQVVEKPFDEWIAEQEGKPVDPATAYRLTTDGDWTGWNRFWFAGAIGGQAADVVSTQNALDRGCSEGNPLFGKSPAVGTMVLVKAGVLGLGYLATEYWMNGDPRQQAARNWIYGSMALVGFGAAGWNISMECER